MTDAEKEAREIVQSIADEFAGTGLSVDEDFFSARILRFAREHGPELDRQDEENRREENDLILDSILGPYLDTPPLLPVEDTTPPRLDAHDAGPQHHAQARKAVLMASVFVLQTWVDYEPETVLGVFSEAYLGQEAGDAHAGKALDWSYESGAYLASDNYRLLPFELDASPRP